MAFIGAVITTIASAIASIVSTIASIISVIVTKIASAIAFIFKTIGGIVTSVVTTVVGAISKIFNAITGLFVNKVYATATQIVSKISSIIHTIFEPVTKLFMQAKSIVLSIKNIVTQIFKPISELITQIFNTIKQLMDSILGWVKPLIDKIRNIYISIKNSIFGKIISTLKEIGDFIGFFHTLARAYEAIKKEKYVDAIFIIAYYFDDQLKQNVKTIMEVISSEASQIISEVNTVFRMMRNDINSIYDTTIVYERIFRDFARIFNAKAFTEIADSIHSFIAKNIERVTRDIEWSRNFVLSQVGYVMNPLYQMLSQIYMWERQEKRYAMLYSYLAGSAIEQCIEKPRWDKKFMVIKRRI